MFNLPALRSRAVAGGLAVGILSVTLSACSTGSTDARDAPKPTTDTTAEADAFPVTIDNAFGSTTIEEEPERVVALSIDGEVALSLGVVPIAVEKNSWAGTPEGSTVWFDEALKEVEGAEAPQFLDATDGMPVDDIIKLEPDVVLGTNSGLTKADYDRLTKAGIPVIAYPGVMWTTTWQESLDLVGQALGRNDLADDVEAETEQVISDTAAEYPELKGATYLFGYLEPSDLSQIGIFTDVDNRPRILEELGMKPASIMAEGPDDTFFFNVSLERASDLESDLLLAYADSDKQAENVVAAPLVSQIPAIKRGSYYISTVPTDSAGLSAPTPLSLPWAMENYIPDVASAMQGTE